MGAELTSLCLPGLEGRIRGYPRIMAGGSEGQAVHPREPVQPTHRDRDRPHILAFGMPDTRRCSAYLRLELLFFRVLSGRGRLFSRHLISWAPGSEVPGFSAARGRCTTLSCPQDPGKEHDYPLLQEGRPLIGTSARAFLSKLAPRSRQKIAHQAAQMPKEKP